MSKIVIFLLDDLNNTKEEINMIKPKNYQEFLKELKEKIKNIPEYYEVFELDKNNKEIKINNEDKYKNIKDFLFIRGINKNIFEQSLFELNYNILSESKQEKLDEKYDCNICSVIIKKEKPYFCYTCQKIFHEKCLKDWESKCKLKNKKFSCPNCRSEFPLENWNKKLNYEENRNVDATLMNKINEYKLNNNLNDNINKIKDTKINELTVIIKKQNELIKKYEDYIGKTIDIFYLILKQINSMHTLLKLKNNNKLNNLINLYPLNMQNLEINNILYAIKEEFDLFKTFIQNNYQINKQLKELNAKEYNNKIKLDQESLSTFSREKQNLNAIYKGIKVEKEVGDEDGLGLSRVNAQVLIKEKAIIKPSIVRTNC